MLIIWCIFLDFSEAIYHCFIASIHRDSMNSNFKFQWIQKKNFNSTTKLLQCIHHKRISTTRWSCRSDTTKTLVHRYFHIQSTLNSIHKDLNELQKYVMKQTDYTTKCVSWKQVYIMHLNEILDRFNATNKVLQLSY